MESYSVCSFSIMSTRFIYVVACDRTSFSSKAESYSIVCIHYSLLIHLSVHGHLSCPYLWLPWTILLWIWVCKYLFRTPLSSLLDACPEAGLLNHILFLFLIFWANHHTVFIAVTQCSKVSVSPYHRQHLLFWGFFDDNHPNECEVYVGWF